MEKQRTYIAIDLKSFYASVECTERDLNPLTTNLIVADMSRTEKTICLAVSPSLKSYGIPGRARMFEALKEIDVANEKRRRKAPYGKFTGESYDALELDKDPSLAIGYIVAPPRMATYIEYSAKIYDVYLRHVAPEDIHVYSIDEVFIDATFYLETLKMTAYEFTRMLIREVLDETGVTATAGIGTNLYLCKIAMDITAKHIPADADGVRIAELDEMSYRKLLWDHRPLTDFWRVGRGISKKLEQHYLYTMGDVARCSLYNENLLYKLFGINAELLIDHAWGYEPCTIADIKAYKPSSNSISSGQVLHCPYSFEKARIVIREMADSLALDLVEKRLLTGQIVIHVGYDIASLTNTYTGEVKTDFYGRQMPSGARGTVNLSRQTSSSKLICEAVLKAFDENVNPELLVRRLNICANGVVREDCISHEFVPEQLSLFENYEEKQERLKKEDEELEKERKIQETVIGIKNRFGKNAILKGTNLQDGATAKDRNRQIGGHKA